MNHRTGLDRSQTLLFPERLEDYIAAENPVRFLDAFVTSLDLHALGFAKAVCANTGRPPYDPAALLKLYLYGYLHRVRSSRLLEAECRRNVEVLWLLGKLAPDFKTIADFRKDNLQPLKAVARQCTVLCRKLELFGGELLAIDGHEQIIDDATLDRAQKPQQADRHRDMHQQHPALGLWGVGEEAQNRQHNSERRRNQRRGVTAAGRNEAETAEQNQNDTEENCESCHLLRPPLSRS